MRSRAWVFGRSGGAFNFFALLYLKFVNFGEIYLEFVWILLEICVNFLTARFYKVRKCEKFVIVSVATIVKVWFFRIFSILQKCFKNGKFHSFLKYGLPRFARCARSQWRFPHAFAPLKKPLAMTLCAHFSLYSQWHARQILASFSAPFFKKSPFFKPKPKFWQFLLKF